MTVEHKRAVRQEVKCHMGRRCYNWISTESNHCDTVEVCGRFGAEERKKQKGITIWQCRHWELRLSSLTRMC